MILRFIKLDVVKLNFPERGWNEGQDVVMDSEPTPFLSAAHLLLDQIHVRHKNDHLSPVYSPLVLFPSVLPGLDVTLNVILGSFLW